MKRVSSIVFVFVFLFNIGGYYYYFRYSLYNNRKEIKHLIRSGLSENDLTLITADASNRHELTWLKAGKEFRYKGEMYDVVKSVYGSNMKKYFCIRDSKEKKLISDFIRNHSRRIDKRIKTALNPYIIQNPLKTSVYSESQVIWYFPVSLYKSVYISNSSPPPWQA